MFKVVMIIVGFVQGAATGVYDPAPAFASMDECKAFYAQERDKLADPEIHATVYCVSETEAVKLQ